MHMNCGTLCCGTSVCVWQTERRTGDYVFKEEANCTNYGVVAALFVCGGASVIVKVFY